jgi:hypothetical protein
MKRRDFMRAGAAAVALAAVPVGAMAASKPRHATLEDLRRFCPNMARHYDQALESRGLTDGPNFVTSRTFEEDGVPIVQTILVVGEWEEQMSMGATINAMSYYDKLLAFHNWRTA